MFRAISMSHDSYVRQGWPDTVQCESVQSCNYIIQISGLKMKLLPLRGCSEVRKFKLNFMRTLSKVL
jgi:hypothetical protein